ncbi:MAG: hypothetical protein Kow009_11590 [Spirochaetales bacterium]
MGYSAEGIVQKIQGEIKAGRSEGTENIPGKNLDRGQGFLLFYEVMDVEGSTGKYLTLVLARLLRVNPLAYPF